MKKLKRVIGLLCALTCTLSGAGLMTACGGEKNPDNGGGGNGASQELEIFATKAGYGISFITEAVNQFKQEAWVQAKYPNLVVKWDENNPAYYSATSSNAVDKATAGPNANKADLIFTTQDIADKIAVLNGTGYYIEDLTDVYFGKIEGDAYYNGSGEGRYLKDKMYADIFAEIDVVNTNGAKKGQTSYYTMPAVNGWMGLIANKTYIEKVAGADAANNLPKTTSELIALLDVIDTTVVGYKKLPNGEDDLSNPIYATPMIGCSNVNYWASEMRVWWTQYEGLKAYDNFFNLQVGSRLGVDNWYQQGRMEALRVMDAIIGGTSESPTKYYDIQGLDGHYIQQQKTFLGGEGAFMYNGDWIENETRQAGVNISDNMVYMKSPVISAVVDKFPGVFTVRYDDATILDQLGKKAQVRNDIDYGSKTNAVKAAQADVQLSYLIGLIDDGKSFDEAKTAYDAQFASAGVALTQAAYDHIAAARVMEHRVDGQDWYIPSYADGKEVAKDFLRFMASDKGTKIIMEKSSTLSPFMVSDDVLDYITYTPTLRSRVERRAETTHLPTLSAYQSYRLAHIRHLTNMSSIESNLSKAGMGAWTVFKNEANYAEEKINEYITNAYPE